MVPEERERVVISSSILIFLLPRRYLPLFHIILSTPLIFSLAYFPSSSVYCSAFYLNIRFVFILPSSIFVSRQSTFTSLLSSLSLFHFTPGPRSSPSLLLRLIFCSQPSPPHNSSSLCARLCMVKVAATSLELETRLHAHQVDTNTRSCTDVILRPSDWLMRSELHYIGYFHVVLFQTSTTAQRLILKG